MKNKAKIVPPNSRWKCTNACFVMDTVDFMPCIIPPDWIIEVQREATDSGYRKHEFVHIHTYKPSNCCSYQQVIPYEQVIACFRPLLDTDKDDLTNSGEPMEKYMTTDEIRGYRERWEKYRKIRESEIKTVE